MMVTRFGMLLLAALPLIAPSAAEKDKYDLKVRKDILDKLIDDIEKVPKQLPEAVEEVLKKAEVIELYSLEPDRRKRAKERFDDWPVLGKTAVKDTETRKKLVAALREGVAGNSGQRIWCFAPRHGIRATHGGKKLEMVICFHCQQLRAQLDGVPQGRLLTDSSPEPVFDKVLKDADVPLAEKEKNKIPEAVQTILKKADAIEVYSLDPWQSKYEPKDDFHGWCVLGHTPLKDSDARKALVAALVKGVEDKKGVAGDCFNPRHGIRATYDGKTVDLVICFECMKVQGYLDKSTVFFFINKRPEETFERVLKAAKVPLPEK
jgi:hypothetical protein